jgi:hypothetical protein
MEEAIKGSGRMESKMEEEFSKTRKDYKKLEYGVMVKKLDGLSDFYKFWGCKFQKGIFSRAV